MEINKSNIWLNRLPTEIIFLIFNYLSNNDIIYTFFDLNERFNNLLLQNERYLNYLELPTTNLDTWKNILSIIGLQIESLNIKEIDFSIPFNLFASLKSLEISVPIDYIRQTLNMIVENKQFQNLYSFKLKENACFSQQFCMQYSKYDNHIFEKVFEIVFNDKSVLETFQCSLVSYSSISTYEKRFKTNFNLHSLTLRLKEFSEVFLLISYTPNLEYLNIQCSPPACEESIHKSNIKLRQLYLTMNWNDENRQSSLNYSTPSYFDSNQIINGIKVFSTSLICLSLNLATIDAGLRSFFSVNHIELQELLESMIELKQFHLYARVSLFTKDDEDILSKFQNEYWLDHQWIFGMHEEYFYTLPFHFDYLYKFDDGFNAVKSNNNEILINNPRIWYNVKSVELLDRGKYNNNFLKQLKIKMPKLECIKFDELWMTSICDDNKTKEIDLRLNDVRFYSEPIGDRKAWLINELPNLKHLVLSAVDLFSSDSQLTELFNERIQRLDIEQCSKLEQLIEISSTYLSNVQYINFRLYWWNGSIGCKYYADMVMEILENFQNLKTLSAYSCLRILRSTDHDVTNLYEYLDFEYIDKNYNLYCYEGLCLFRKRLLL